MTEATGSRYYLWTSATVDRATTARIVASARHEGEQPHASEVLTPAAVFCQRRTTSKICKRRCRCVREPIRSSSATITAGRGYFVVKRDEADSQPAKRTPLAMTWFDDPSVIRFDVHAGTQACRMVPFHLAARFACDDGHRTRDCRGMGRRSAHACRGTGPVRGGRSAAPRRRRRAARDARNRIQRCGGVSRSDPVGLRTGRRRALGDWSQAGVLECYSGGAWYRKTDHADRGTGRRSQSRSTWATWSPRPKFA